MIPRRVMSFERVISAAEHLADVWAPAGRALEGAERRRTHVLVWLCAVCAVAALSLSITFALAGHARVAGTQAVAATVLALFPLLLRLTASIDLVSRVFLGCATVVVAALAWRQGGIMAPVAAVVVIVPAMAALLMRVGEALLWAGVALLLLLGLYALAGAAAEPAVRLSPALALVRAIVVLVLGTFVVVVLQSFSRGAFEALRLSEAHARALLEAIPDAVLRVGHDGRILDGIAPPAWDVLSPHLSSSLAEVTASQRALALERAVGHQVFEVRVAPIDPHSAIVMVRDVTARREMEQALHTAERARVEAVTAERLARADKLAALGRVAAGMAHEINNPLTFVLANLGYVREQLGATEQSNADLDDALRDALEGARRVQRIVAGLRVFSRTDDAVAERIDPSAAIDMAIDVTSNEIRHRARLVRPRGALPAASLPPGRLEQVLVNLLSNAIHAIPQGRVDEHEVSVISSVTPDGSALIEVKDTGCGIAPEQLARIPEPFFTTKPVGQGVGLGLIISFGIIQEAGGELWLESELGRGTSAFVRLPAAPTAPLAAPSPPPSPVPASERRLRILVVDDDELVLKAIGRMLADHELVRLDSGREAVTELLGGAPFDAVLCDLMMPDRPGMDVYEEVSRARPGLASRFVFMTGGVLSSVGSEFTSRFSGRVLSKPFSRADFDAVLAKALRAAAAVERAGTRPS